MVFESNVDQAKNLVHFVSAKKVFQHDVLGMECDQSWLDVFAELEESLQDFILNKRMISKLMPAALYLQNLLCDIEVGFMIFPA